MKFSAYDINKIERRYSYKKSDNLIFLESFIDSGLECAKVENYPHKNADSCLASLKASIKHYNMNGIECCMCRREIYLIRKG